MKDDGFIQIRNGRYFIGWWFFQCRDMNWFGTVFRDGGKLIAGTSLWEMRYSFRYFHPDSTRNRDLDRKSRYGGTIKEKTEEEVYELFNTLAVSAAKQMGAPLQYTDLRCSAVDEIVRKLGKQPWANFKELR